MTFFKTINLASANLNFQALLSNGKQYTVPQFQRNYSWGSEQWQDLWNDIQYLPKSSEQHFIGNLVLQTTDDENFTIIDGQQRITTLIIIIVAAIGRLEYFIAQGEDTEKNKQRVEQYERLYLKIKDMVSFNDKPKLTLNRHNNTHFKDILREKEPFQQRNLNASNRTLNKAIRYFGKQLESYANGVKVAQLIENISKGLLFTANTVPDDINAFAFFESINARGVHLSAPDLIKNYLMSLIAQDDDHSPDIYDDFEEQWAGILEQLGEQNFTEFLRSYMGMWQNIPAQRNLFRVLKKDITKSEKSFPYLYSLKEYAPLYVALRDERDDFWKEKDEVKKHLAVLNLFNIKTPSSLLMAAYHNMSNSDFIGLVKNIAICSFRFNVICNYVARDQETLYNKMAMRLTKDESTTTLDELTSMLAPIYPSNDEFLLHFSTKSMPSRQTSKKIRYILGEIEKHLQGGQYQIPDEITVEHILPKTPVDEWQESFGRDHYLSAINRLGNMALLTKKENQEVGQKPFEQKGLILEKSLCKINQKIATYSSWDMESLEQYQKWLALQAQTLWKIPQLEPTD